jgi:hypothetical protein
MDVFDRILKEHSWRFPKGYPDMNDPSDKKFLFDIVEGYKYKIKEEETEKNLIDKLVDVIRSSDLSDDELQAYIKSINNRGHKGNITKKLADKGYTADRFKFKDKALDKISKDLDDTDLESYFKYLENPKSLKDLKSSGKFHTELGLPNELVSAFVNIEPGADQTGSAIGKAELFLSMFFADIGNSTNKINKETGEVIQAKGDNSWEGVGNLEVKGTGGRLGQQGGRGLDATALFKRLVSDLLPEDEAEEFISKHSKYWTMSKSISELYTQVKENGTPETEIQNKITDVLDKVYWDHNMAKNYFKTSNDFTDLEEITKNLLKLNAESYSKEKGIDAILFIDTAGGQNKYIIVKKDDYNDTIDNKKFWTTTKSPTGFQWKNVNPNLNVGNV